jgi:uncharacterized protein YjbI with pentapeptide repeats
MLLLGSSHVFFYILITKRFSYDFKLFTFTIATVAGYSSIIFSENNKSEIDCWENTDKIKNLKRLRDTGECSGCNLAVTSLNWGILADALKNNPGKIIDLKDADLTGASLEETDLSRVDLTGAILIKADLKNANMKGTQLAGATIHYADFSGADAEGANFNAVKGRANFTGANLKNTKFVGADLLNVANLGAHIVKCFGTDILNNARLGEFSKFDDANLQGADFTSSIIDKHMFSKAKNVLYANFSNSALSSFMNLKALWYSWKK